MASCGHEILLSGLRTHPPDYPVRISSTIRPVGATMSLTPRGVSMAISRRHFFYGSLLAGAVPTGGFGSTPSLKMMGYKSPNEKLNIASIGAGGRAGADIRG